MIFRLCAGSLIASPSCISGASVESAPAEVIFEKSRHPYTEALALSKLDMNVHKRDFYTLPGEIPSPVNAPPGCPFAPRCARATPECSSAFPQLSRIDNGVMFHCYNPVAA